MAVKKGILKRKNNSGTYDEINLQTSAEQVKMADGKTVQAFLDSLPTGDGAGAKVVADITARDAGSIGGEMVRKMIKRQEEEMAGQSR